MLEGLPNGIRISVVRHFQYRSHPGGTDLEIFSDQKQWYSVYLRHYLRVTMWFACCSHWLLVTPCSSLCGRVCVFATTTNRRQQLQKPQPPAS